MVAGIQTSLEEPFPPMIYFIGHKSNRLTSIGINNTGELTLTYGKEDTDYRTDGDPSSGYIFNGAESKFFCRIRDLMRDKLQAMYVNRESAGAWSNLVSEFDNAQDEFPEELWRLEYVRLYERTYREGTPRFLVSMSNGKKKYQRRQFERDQEPYFGTKYYGNNITSDQIMFRCNTPLEAVVSPNYTLHLTPYSDMYLSVMFGATYRTQIRAKAGIQYDIDCPFNTMDDTAVLIYCASRIQDVGDLSACYIHDNDFTKGSKLQKIILSSDISGYSNPFLTTVNVGSNNKLLAYLDVRNTPNYTDSLNLSGCGEISEVYAEGSGLTAVTFPDGGKLKIAHLPAVTALTMKNLAYIEDFQVEGFDNLRTFVIENTPAINTYSYVIDSPNLANVRLVGIDWGSDEGIKDTSILDRLIKIAGIDSQGYNTLISVLAGKFYSPSVKQKLLAEYIEAWPDLVITYDTLVTQFTVTFVNEDGTVLDVQYVDKGGNAVDPITRVNNPIEIPTKESTVSTDFTFSTWDTSLDNIFSDRKITAQYSESVRQYTVKYVAKSYVLQETKAPYGSSVAYTGDIPTYTDEESAYVFYLFTGWDKSGYVDGNKIINAVYDRFEYTDGSLDGLDISEMSEVQVYAMLKLGKESDLVSVKDSLTITMGSDYSYDDIEEKVLISEKTVFGGSNYIDTGIKLLDEDKDWTLAIDYRFDEGNSVNSVLMQCYQSDGSNGFKLWNSSAPRITWGTSSTSSAAIYKRDMAVLRHIKGETQIHVYKGNIPAENIDYTTLSATRVVAQNQTLVFGCSRADDGAYENYAYGTIYWCKLWYSDLGDAACRDIVNWTHESITGEMGGYKRFYLADGSGKRCSLTFMAAHALTNTMPLNSSTSNSGGWASYSLNRFLNNRFYNALPVTWKQIIKEVKVPSTIGNKSTDVTTSNCYIAIPSVIEVDANMMREPYTFEGETFSFITSDASRIRKNPDNEAVEYWLRSPNPEYENYIFSVTTSGTTEGYSYGLYDKSVVIIFSI